MELFRLLGTVAVNTQDAIRDIDDTSKHSEELSDAFEKTAEKAATFGAKVLATTEAVVTAIGGMAVASSANMESALDSFAASTGVVNEELAEYEDTLKEIYADNYGESFEDIAKSMAEIKKQVGDIGADDLKEMTTDALLLRDTFEFEVNESTRAAKMLMDQFGMTSKEAFNLIAQGAQNGLDKNGDLLDSINEYAVHYKQMGYSGQQFFNSLKNGTEAGTFSVDKLGDAMKEFGIRVKDTSTTTTDAFSLLGYGAGASAEEIAKTKKEISKLEKELKYAKKEQEGFNDKTSELTKMKNADKIAEYTSELELCRAKLTDLTTESGTSLGNINDLQERFAAGGETAREATEEVLTALYNMDDKVQQNAAGVGLFGSMWEDLGIDGIKALTEVEGGIDTATDALTEMAEVKYDNLNSEMDGLKRKIESTVITPLGQKVEPIISKLIKKVEKKLPQIQKLAQKLGDVVVKGFDKLEPAIEWLIDDALPVLVDILEFCIENFETLAGVIATVYGAIKTLTIIKSVTTAVEGATGAFQIFGGVLGSLPIMAVVGAVGGLAIGIGALISSSEEEVSQMDIVKEKLDNDRIAREERLQAIEDEMGAIEKKAEAELVEIANVEDLWQELQILCDEEGNVKDADKARADFILNELNEALGTEYKMTGNQITQYQDMKASIDDLILARRAEILLAMQEEKYKTALNAIEEQQNKLKEESIKLDEQKQKYAGVEKYALEDIAIAKSKIDALEKQRESSLSTDSAKIARINEEIIAEQAYIEQLEEAIEREKMALDNQQANYENAQETLQIYYQEMADFENASAALLEGNTEEAIAIIDSMGKTCQTAAQLAEEGAEKQLEILKKQMDEAALMVEENEKMLEKADESNKKIYERQLENAKQYFEDCKLEYQKAGGTFADSLTTGFESEQPDMLDRMQKAGGVIAEGITKGFESKQTTMTSRFQSALNSSVAGLKFDAFNNVGKDMLAGVAKGMEEKEIVVCDEVRNFLNKSVDEAKKVADIHSPSRLFAREVGAYIPSGVAMGIEENKDEALDSVDNMVGLMASSGQGKTSSFAGTGATVSDSSLLAGKLDQLIQLMSAMTQQRIYLNGDVLVGELAPAMNTELGNISALTERGQ